MSNWKSEALRLAQKGMSWRAISRKLEVPKSSVSDFLRSKLKGYVRAKDKPLNALTGSPSDLNSEGVGKATPTGENAPRVLVLDIETKYLTTNGWGLWNQNFSLDQIEEDWSIISFSAKWYGVGGIHYYDITKFTEEELLAALWVMLNQADFCLTHNGRRFDLKKIRARMIAYGMTPYSPVRVIDTLEIAKKEFSFTSNKLMYLTNLLCKKHVKSDHAKFAGFLLWKEFIAGNPEAIQEMRDYNTIDVQSLEELYDILAPWSSTLPVFEIYDDNPSDMTDWKLDGYHYSNLGKYERFKNTKTGQFRRGRVNLLSKEKRATLLANII